MQIFILPHVENLTGSYHSDGGAVIIARDLQRAKEIMAEHAKEYDAYDPKEPIQVTEEEWAKAESFYIGSETEKHWIFPDAGCC
jgi:hypothetical protein